MRNKFEGICYRCGLIVLPNKGHFERHQGSWRVQHTECAIKFRAIKESNSDKENKEN